MSAATFLLVLLHFDFDICDLLLNRRSIVLNFVLFSVFCVLLPITYAKLDSLPYLLFSRHFYIMSNSHKTRNPGILKAKQGQFPSEGYHTND